MPRNNIDVVWNPFEADSNKSFVFKKYGLKVLVNSVKEIFGIDANHSKILKIIEFCKLNPNCEFVFQTRVPFAYRSYNFPANCTLGLIVDKYRENEIEMMRSLRHVKCKRALTIEPITGSFEGVDLKFFDHVTVGCDSDNKPMLQWLTTIDNKNVFYKRNIKKFYPQL